MQNILSVVIKFLFKIYKERHRHLNNIQGRFIPKVNTNSNMQF